jgi:WD40 repeat protein
MGPALPAAADADAERGVFSVALSPDGRLAAAGALDGAVRVWDLSSSESAAAAPYVLRAHEDGVYSVAFTPDGKGLVSGSLDRTCKYWDLRAILSGGGSQRSRGVQSTLEFAGHKDYVLSVAVSPDGRYVVSGSKDRGVQFWDARTAQGVLMLQGHKNSGACISSFLFLFLSALFWRALAVQGPGGGSTSVVCTLSHLLPCLVPLSLCLVILPIRVLERWEK